MLFRMRAGHAAPPSAACVPSSVAADAPPGVPLLVGKRDVNRAFKLHAFRPEDFAEFAAQLARMEERLSGSAPSRPRAPTTRIHAAWHLD